MNKIFVKNIYIHTLQVKIVVECGSSLNDQFVLFTVS